jgi:transposase-like protein
MAVRWYVAYALSYRDIEEMMAERGIKVDHASVNRWVVKYAPWLESRFIKKHKKSCSYQLEDGRNLYKG